MFDAQSGKEMGKPFQHTVEVAAVLLDQSGPTLDRCLAFVDKNRCACTTGFFFFFFFFLGLLLSSTRFQHSNTDTDTQTHTDTQTRGQLVNTPLALIPLWMCTPEI